jgi:hypothetical protein
VPFYAWAVIWRDRGKLENASGGNIYDHLTSAEWQRRNDNILRRRRGKIMGKGCQPRKGHNAAKQRKNYDEIDWSKPKEPKKSK